MSTVDPEFIPSTLQIRIAYALPTGELSPEMVEARGLAFDRWLRQRDQLVADKVIDSIMRRVQNPETD